MYLASATDAIEVWCTAVEVSFERDETVLLCNILKPSNPCRNIQ